MNRTRFQQPLAVLLLATIALVGCKKDTPAPPPASAEPPVVLTPAPAPAAVSVVSVDLATAVAADAKLATPVGSFAPTDTIIAVISTSTLDPMASLPGKLGARWTFQDGQVVNDESQDVVFTGAGTTQFQIAKPDGWPAGNYKVEISLNGVLAQSRDFSVQ